MSAQRRSPAIPLSPSSPPELGLKQRRKRRLSDESQRYPSTPPLMSVATKSYGPSYGNGQSMEDQNSPSSPTSSYTQPFTSTQPTQHSLPVSAASGSSQLGDSDAPDQHRDKRQKMETEVPNNEQTEGRSKATNHDRQGESMNQSHTGNDRASGIEIEGSVLTGSKIGTVPDSTSLNDLNTLMREGYLLCKSTLPRSQPDSSTHLLSHYGLIPLLKTVSRNDPQTGEKINKLRKSYEGQIKMFGLAGRNRSVKAEVLDNQTRPLRHLVENMSEEEWKQHHQSHAIGATEEFRSKLRSAVKLLPGTVRNNAHWEDVLGHERPRPGLTVPSVPPAVTVATLAPPPRQPNGNTRPQVRIQPDVTRPRRSGKKRSYGDSSFEGYGDGFEDDDIDDDGSRFEDDDEGSARKKRRKEHSFSVSPVTYGGYGR